MRALTARWLPAAPRAGTLYYEGQDGRYLLDGPWLHRDDPGGSAAAALPRSTSTRGWTRVAVPHAWNVGDGSPESMRGEVRWYRKDFELPSASAAYDWIVRFESVNNRVTAWLNGRRVGSHRGPFLPFEKRLPGVRRSGTNRLVLRVDSRRARADFPPYGESSDGIPAGGWFNYGGLLREVYLRRVDALDVSRVQVTPSVPCSTCPATVRISALVRNHGAARVARVRASFGERSLALGARQVGSGGAATFTGSLRIGRPQLWTPADPRLHSVRVTAAGAGGTGTYRLRTGIRASDVADGRLRLNGRPIRFNGVGYHEEVAGKGSALGNADREWLVDQAHAVGANLMRTHYPPHPQLQEYADRTGMLIWSEVPVYQMKNSILTERRVRRRAVRLARENVLDNANHPSVIVWSLANELSAEAGPTQAYYFRDAARAVERLDPSRPTALAVAGYPSVGCQPEYRPVDFIGINQYFGWYTGPYGETFDRSKLGDFLEQVRACYPNKGVAVTEFGAEANRDGPAEEKGTYAFQAEFADFHLGVFESKSWLSGASYWALNEFWVRPGWEGGNPRPASPLHQKGLLTFAGDRKPAWEVVRRHYAGGG